MDALVSRPGCSQPCKLHPLTNTCPEAPCTSLAFCGTAGSGVQLALPLSSQTASSAHARAYAYNMHHTNCIRLVSPRLATARLSAQTKIFPHSGTFVRCLAPFHAAMARPSRKPGAALRRARLPGI
ncbi:hypothetical protein M3J09_013087 [Ascochyta lentis]